MSAAAPQQPREHVRLADVAKEFPVGKTWITEQVKLGRIRAYKPSKLVTLFRRADLVALMEGRSPALEGDADCQQKAG